MGVPGSAPLTWGSRGALSRSRGSGGQPPSWTAAVGGRVGPCGLRAGDHPSPMGPGPRRQGQLQTAGRSSGSGREVGGYRPSVPPSSSSWLSPGFPPATWCHCGRTPGFSVAGAGRGEHGQGQVAATPKRPGCASRPLAPQLACRYRQLRVSGGAVWMSPWEPGPLQPPAPNCPGSECAGQSPQSPKSKPSSRTCNDAGSPSKAQRAGLPPRPGPASGLTHQFILHAGAESSRGLVLRTLRGSERKPSGAPHCLREQAPALGSLIPAWGRL